MTCCLTGLPIGAGDKVKYFLLTENPYEDRVTVCYSHDMWYPRSWPLDAEYNDYGSIENYDPDGPGVYSIIQALKQDLVEVGTGDNSVHDVPAKRGMPFEKTLEALWEGRITVCQKAGWLTSSHSRLYNAPAWLPTLQKIEDLLTEAGYQIGTQDGMLLVDEREGGGWVRVRNGGYSGKVDLQTLLPLLSDYAAVVTAGSGSYSNRSEIQIMPRPAAPEDKNDHRSFMRLDSKDHPKRVYQAMILTKAWDELIKSCDYQLSRERVEAAWNQKLQDLAKANRDEDIFLRYCRAQDYKPGMVYAESLIAKSPIPFTMGLAEHFDLVLEQHLKKPFTQAQISNFLDNVAGFGCIHELIGPLRYWWRPSFSCGPQTPEYKPYLSYFQTILNVSQSLHQQYLEEYGEFEFDDELQDESQD